jgi:D-alanyl-D-alanine carboxypeptidase
MSRQVEPAEVARFVAESRGTRRGAVHAFCQGSNGTHNIRVGRRDSTGGELSTNDAFRVGSISKLMVATLVLTLRDGDRPLIDVDAPIATYLGSDSVGARATIRALLSHRSGIPGYTDHPCFEEATLAARDRWWTPQEVLDTFVDDSPGEALTAIPSYSNTNYLLLGLAIEAVTNRPLHDVVRDELAGRVGLTRTLLPHAGWERPGWLVPGWSPGTLRGHPEDAYTSFESAAWAAGGMISSVADLTTLIDALFDDEFLDPIRRNEMMTPAVGDFGFGLRTMQLGRREWLGHLGVIRGYMSAIRLDRRSQDKVIVLTNDDLINVDVLANQLAATLDR